MTKKILIIDDEPDIVVYLKVLLENNGYSVVTASNGQEGFELARTEAPDLICLDIKMYPKLKKLPCIIISAYESAYSFKGQAFRRLVQDRTIPEPLKFFEKPIDVNAFLEFINGYLSKAKKK
jgi:DNA-binding NtrC family response regulator